jgi:hypothetical protein
VRFCPLFSVVFEVSHLLEMCAFVLLPSFPDFSKPMLEK